MSHLRACNIVGVVNVFRGWGGEVVEVVMDVVGSGGRGGMTVDAVAAMVMVDAVVGGAAVVFLVELVG